MMLDTRASNNITKSSVSTVLAQVPAQVFGIVAGIFISRILGPEGKGNFTLFQTNATLFYSLFGFSLTNSIIFYIGSKRMPLERLKSIITGSFVLTLSLSILTIICWLAFPTSKPFTGTDTLNWIIILLFIFTVLITQINAAFTAIFQGLKHFRTVNKILILNSVYTLVIFSACYLIYISGNYLFSFQDILWLFLLILIVNTIHWLFELQKINFPSQWIKVEWQSAKSFFNFTSLNHISNIFLFLNHRIILWIIAFCMTAYEVGIYSIGMGISLLLYLVTTPLLHLLEAFLNTETAFEKIRIFSVFSRVQFTFIVLFIIVAMLLCPILIPFLYGTEYKDSSTILTILLIGVLFACQSGVISSFFIVSNQIRFNLFASGIGTLIILLFAPMMIRNYGLEGAAYTQIGSQGFIYVFLLIKIYRQKGMELNLFLIRKNDLKLLRRQLFKR